MKGDNRMKKTEKALIVLAVTSSAVITLISVLVVSVIGINLMMVAFIADSQVGPESLLESSQSPDGRYYLEAYRTNPGATVDFSVKVYRVNNDKKELIYFVYHESEVTINWIDDNTVSINGRSLDLSKNEKYDKRV